MLAPGSAFGCERHLRIGLGQEPGVFQEGLDTASRCFDALRRAAPGAPPAPPPRRPP